MCACHLPKTLYYAPFKHCNHTAEWVTHKWTILHKKLKAAGSFNYWCQCMSTSTQKEHHWDKEMLRFRQSFAGVPHLWGAAVGGKQYSKFWNFFKGRLSDDISLSIDSMVSNTGFHLRKLYWRGVSPAQNSGGQDLKLLSTVRTNMICMKV